MVQVHAGTMAACVSHDFTWSHVQKSGDSLEYVYTLDILFTSFNTVQTGFAAL